MNVLIFGAAGQLGRALMRHAPASWVVTGVDLPEVDITSRDAVEGAFVHAEPDLVINCAAYTAVDKAQSEAAKAAAVNAIGPRYIAKTCLAVGARLLHVSTDFVFDGGGNQPYGPDATPSPLSVYGSTKRAGETVVLGTLPETSVVVRTSWLYGPNPGNFVATMLRLMSERGAVSVIDDQVGTPTSTDSLAETLWKLAERPDLHGVYHWSDAGVASWYDFAVAIAEEGLAAGVLSAAPTVTPIPTSGYPTPAKRPPFSVLDSRATEVALGITRRHWRARLREALSAWPG